MIPIASWTPMLVAAAFCIIETCRHVCETRRNNRAAEKLRAGLMTRDEHKGWRGKPWFEDAMPPAPTALEQAHAEEVNREAAYFARYSSDIFNPPAPGSFQPIPERTAEMEKYIAQFRSEHSTKNPPKPPPA